VVRFRFVRERTHDSGTLSRFASSVESITCNSSQATESTLNCDIRESFVFGGESTVLVWKARWKRQQRPIFWRPVLIARRYEVGCGSHPPQVGSSRVEFEV
jgi:hypothetical protein